MTDVQAMIMTQEGTGPVRGDTFSPYTDSVGILTIGYGHNLEAKGVPRTVVNMLLSEDIADAIDDVRHVCSVYDQLSRPRQLVLISMAFNLGREGLNQWPRFLGAVHLGNWADAADEILNSKAASQAKVRYQTLATMMRENTSQWI